MRSFADPNTVCERAASKLAGQADLHAGIRQGLD